MEYITMDDVRMVWLQLLNATSQIHHAYKDLRIPIAKTFHLVEYDPLIGGLFQGVIAYRADSMLPLCNVEQMKEVGAILVPMVRDMLDYYGNLYTKGWDDKQTTPLEDQAKKTNRCTSLTFKQFEHTIYDNLAYVNQIIQA